MRYEFTGINFNTNTFQHHRSKIIKQKERYVTEIVNTMQPIVNMLTIRSLILLI